MHQKSAINNVENRGLNGKDSNSGNHFCECRHLLPFKEGKFGVVWAFGGSNSN